MSGKLKDTSNTLLPPINLPVSTPSPPPPPTYVHPLINTVKLCKNTVKKKGKTKKKKNQYRIKWYLKLTPLSFFTTFLSVVWTALVQLKTNKTEIINNFISVMFSRRHLGPSLLKVDLIKRDCLINKVLECVYPICNQIALCKLFKLVCTESVLFFCYKSTICALLLAF